MPCFFFDLYDGETAVRDEFGIELASVEEVAEQAAALLPDLARDASPDRESRDFGALVRDESGALIYRAAFLYRGQRTGDREPSTRLSPPAARELILRSRETRAAAERAFARLEDGVADLLTVIQQTFNLCEQLKADRDARV